MSRGGCDKTRFYKHSGWGHRRGEGGRKMVVTVLMTLRETEHRTARHVTDRSWRGRYLVWLRVLIYAEFQPWGAHEDRPNWHLSRIETFNPVVINNLLNGFTLDIFGIIDILKMICTWEREEGWWCRLSQLGANGRKENSMWPKEGAI